MPSVRRMVKKVFPSTRLKKFENAVIIEIMKDEWLEMMEVDAFPLFGKRAYRFYHAIF